MRAGWVEASVHGVHWWTDRLFSLRLRAPAGALAPWRAGQFNRLALNLGGEWVGRPYSYVNPPQSPELDFYLVTVPGGRLSNALARLKPGDAVAMMEKSQGFFTLDELPDVTPDDSTEAPTTLWLMATGTAVGPYLSMLRTAGPFERFERVVLVHAVRYPEDRNYGDVIADLGATWGERFRFVSVVSRADRPDALRGRIPALLQSGAIESEAGTVITPRHAQVMLCGNPQMVIDTQNVLQARGLERNRKRKPGHVTVENYW
ncbi:MAG: ferredoxin--NADP reductase [Thioalkalivibrionaceae bacterium]